MSLSVGDVLELDVVQAGQPEVLAGRSNLGRPVRWVHIADVFEIAPLLKGGELLLTSGLSLTRDERRRRAYIDQIAEANVAGLFMTLGWAVGAAPDAMVNEAERLGLPFVVLHKPIPFVEVTERVHSEIVSRQFVMIRKAEQIGRSFTDIVLRGSGVRPVIEGLGGLVSRPIVLENAVHQVVESWDPTDAIDDVLSTWETHARTGHDHRSTPPGLQLEGSDAACEWMPIPLHQEEWGRLHVFLLGNPLDEIDRLAVDRAAIAIALILLSQKDAAQIVEQVGGDLIADILRSGFRSEEEVHRRSRALGCDLREKRLVAIAVDADGFAAYVGQHRLGEPEVQAIKRSMLEAVRRAIAGVRCVGVAAIDSDEVLAIVGVPADEDFNGTIDGLGETVRRLVPELARGITATVGMSREALTILALPRAFEEAREAVMYGKSLSGGPGVHRFESLGLNSLILRLRDSAELPHFVEAELGPLLEHDAKRRQELLPTLRAYLDNGMNKSATAKAIHLERRSLYHRLDRISSVLGRDLEDMETCTRLFVALKALSILRRRGAGR